VLGLNPPPPNAAPVAIDDTATTDAGVPVSVPVAANDSDPDGDPLTVTAVGPAGNGAAAIEASGTSVRYTPAPGFAGTDAFGYTVSDGHGGTASATVTVTVLAPPPTPTPPPPTPTPPPPTPTPPPPTPTPPAATLHVGDLDATASSTGKNWTARVTIRVHGPGDAPAPGVLVIGTWGAGATGAASCTTGANGACTVQKTKLAKATVASVTLTIMGMALSGATYDPAANHDPDGESTGTAITVARPG
jgi:hypothetical protein